MSVLLVYKEIFLFLTFSPVSWVTLFYSFIPFVDLNQEKIEE